MKKEQKVLTELHEKLLAVSEGGRLANDSEKVHTFRVTYKRLRAFLRLLRSVTPKNRKVRMPANLKSVYRRLGKIRDWQLLYASLLRHPSAGSFTVLELIKGYISSQQKIVEGIAFPKIISSSKEYLCNHLREGAGLTDVERYLDEKRAALREISGVGPFGDDHFHSFRKGLKDIYYIIYLAPSINIDLSANVRNQGNSKEVYVSVMKELGDYNDICIAINHLASIAWRDPGIIEPILHEWIGRKHSWRHELHSKLIHLEALWQKQLVSVG